MTNTPADADPGAADVFAVAEGREKQVAFLTATLMAIEGREGVSE